MSAEDQHPLGPRVKPEEGKEEGEAAPLGVSLREEGVNVAVVSRHAEAVFVCLFDGEEETARVQLPGRTGDVHHGFLPGIRAGQRYSFRAAGPWDPPRAHRFDPSKLLLDPCARAIDRPCAWHPELAVFGSDTAPLVPKCIVTYSEPQAPPLPAKAPGFIYEIAVRAFTRLHPAIPEHRRGTVGALAHPAVIDYLVGLGVDMVELMPLAAWIDERHLAPLKLANAWGYNPVSFFAPDPRLAPGGFAEIRAAVKALHEAGIRVVLDVVFNHTGESDLEGAVLSLRGLDNALYYLHEDGRPVNHAGTGNTLAVHRAPVAALVLDALRTWASATGVDGFRYDLATVMGRTARGFDPKAPLLMAIAHDPVLAPLIHIAEPWDAGPGGYQLGRFPRAWHEWNDRYRDDVRRFWKGDGSAGAFATRLAGSSDVFEPSGKPPSRGVNYLASHDGFTLLDTVSFAARQNEANGEGGRDGNPHEPSWVAADPKADVRAMLATLFLSRGLPMLTAGDELGRTQRGNNNAYAQDNPVTWLDWANADRDLIRFVAALVRFRRARGESFADRFLEAGEVLWLEADGTAFAGERWNAGDVSVLGLIAGDLAMWFNRSAAEADVRLSTARWSLALASATGSAVEGGRLVVAPRSVAVLEETPARGAGRGPGDEDVAALAAAAGIQPGWRDWSGAWRTVGLDTQRALLEALGFSLASAADVDEARHALAALKDGRVETHSGLCHLPAFVSEGRRVFGLASHLYALRDVRDAGIGDFETLAGFAETTARLGGALAGINPLHHLFPGNRGRASPYQPSDRRFLDPVYIDIHALGVKPEIPAKLRAGRYVDYPAVWRLKENVLIRAFAECGRAPEPAFEAFIAEGGAALARHGEFEARKAGASPRYHMWLQWVADRQLAAAAKRAKDAGLEVGFYRDLALGCAYDGGEVAAAPHLFATAVSLGAPPDRFNAAGQVWNLPPFNPHALARAQFRPYRDILRANMRHAGALRIDHILGAARQFWAPRGAAAADGAYVTFPLEDLIAVIAEESRRARCLVIGEDLGTVPEGLRPRLAAAQILSCKVLWFERDHGVYRPSGAYPRLAAACLSTHDLATFEGWRRSAETDEKRALEEAVAAAGFASGDLLADVHAFVAATPSVAMLVQADDLAGEAEPLNVPGTDAERPNWRRRLSLTVEALAEDETARRVIAAVRRERIKP